MTAPQFAVKQGDVVALVVHHSSTRVHGPTERRKAYTLAIVRKASRNGLAIALARASGRSVTLHKDFESPDVLTIRAELQSAALKAFAKLTWPDDEFDDNTALKDAIRAEKSDV